MLYGKASSSDDARDTSQHILRDEFDLEREPFEHQMAEHIAAVQSEFDCHPSLARHISECAEYEYTLQLMKDLQYGKFPSSQSTEEASNASVRSLSPATGIEGTMFPWYPLEEEQSEE
jgi:hypothetical protein